MFSLTGFPCWAQSFLSYSPPQVTDEVAAPESFKHVTGSGLLPLVLNDAKPDALWHAQEMWPSKVTPPARQGHPLNNQEWILN